MALDITTLDCRSVKAFKFRTSKVEPKGKSRELNMDKAENNERKMMIVTIITIIQDRAKLIDQLGKRIAVDCSL